MHRARLNALTAADALRVSNALVLIFTESKERIGALEHRDFQRELGNTHHRAAHQQLVGGRLKAATSVNQLFNRGTDAHFKVFGFCDSRTRNGYDTAHDRHTSGKAAVNRAGGIHVKDRAARVRRQLARRHFASGAGVDELLFRALRVLTLERIQMQPRVVLDKFFNLGERILLVDLNANDAALGTDDVTEHF